MRIVDATKISRTTALVLGRDVRRSALETRRLEQGARDTNAEHGLCMVGLPELLAGQVALGLGHHLARPASRRLRSPIPTPTLKGVPGWAQAQLDYYHGWPAIKAGGTGDRSHQPQCQLESWESDHAACGHCRADGGRGPIRTRPSGAVVRGAACAA